MSTYKTGAVIVTVDYGYDIHSIEFSGKTWARIQAGKVVTIRGQGFFNEESWEVDRWSFNGEEPGSLSVITEEGRDIYDGNLDDDEVGIDFLPRTEGK